MDDDGPHIPNPPAEDPFDEVMKCIYGEEVSEEDESPTKRKVKQMTV